MSTKLKTQILSCIFLFLGLPVNALIIYVSPDGNDANDGSTINQPVTISQAISLAQAGTTIYLLDGRYFLTQRLELKNNGSSDKPITIEAYLLEHPILDATNVPISPSDKSHAIYISGNYYHLKGIEITNAYKQGMVVRGKHNTIENCVSHHNGNNGFSITLEVHGVTNLDGELAAYNSFINCDSYFNFDWYKTTSGLRTAGSDANGFGCSLNSGKGNSFYGCRSWSNSDDGFDLFESGFDVLIDNCWTWRTGVIEDFAEIFKQKTGETLSAYIFNGNGNGFKLGGNHGVDGSGCTKQSTGTHTLRNSISFQNRVRGIDQNAHKDGAVVENCVSFDNGINIRFWQNPNPGKSFIFRNNIIFGAGTDESGFSIPITSDNNSWDKGQPVYTADDFVTVRIENAIAPRESNGSLPVNYFGKLKSTIELINPSVENQSTCYISNNILHVICHEKGKLILYNSTGQLKQIIGINENNNSIDFSSQFKGIYFAKIISENKNIITKLLRN